MDKGFYGDYFCCYRDSMSTASKGLNRKNPSRCGQTVTQAQSELKLNSVPCYQPCGWTEKLSSTTNWIDKSGNSNDSVKNPNIRYRNRSQRHTDAMLLSNSSPVRVKVIIGPLKRMAVQR
jgi:hypothetical protein